jgi:hypothetical protein
MIHIPQNQPPNLCLSFDDFNDCKNNSYGEWHFVKCGGHTEWKLNIHSGMIFSLILLCIRYSLACNHVIFITHALVNQTVCIPNDPINYIVHYCWLEPYQSWSKVVHNVGNSVPFGTQPQTGDTMTNQHNKQLMHMLQSPMSQSMSILRDQVLTITLTRPDHYSTWLSVYTSQTNHIRVWCLSVRLHLMCAFACVWDEAAEIGNTAIDSATTHCSTLTSVTHINHNLLVSLGMSLWNLEGSLAGVHTKHDIIHNINRQVQNKDTYHSMYHQMKWNCIGHIHMFSRYCCGCSEYLFFYFPTVQQYPTSNI